MRFLKRVIVAANLIAACAITSSAFAQRPMRQPSPQEKADRQIHWMDKNLGLNDEQHAKVYDILLYYARERSQANHQDPPGPGKQQEKRSLRHDENGELRSVLTGQQFALYKQHQQQMKERRQQHRADMQPAQGGY